MEAASDLGLKPVTKGKALLGEGPLWDHRQGVLYWVDIERSQIHQFSPGTGETRTLEMPCMVGSVALYGEADLIAAAGRAFYQVNFGRSQIVELPGSRVVAESCLMNDGKADRQGRFLAGAKDLKEENPLANAWIFDQGRIGEVLTGFTVFNGPAFSPDGTVVYYTNSPGRVIYRADYDPEAGTVGQAEAFAELTGDEGYPDGMTVDAEGGLWNAHWDGWRITRYHPDGTRDRVIEMPVRRPTSLAFGGQDLKTLFVTSASTRLTSAELKDNPDAGTLYSLVPGQTGLPEEIVKV